MFIPISDNQIISWRFAVLQFRDSFSHRVTSNITVCIVLDIGTVFVLKGSKPFCVSVEFPLGLPNSFPEILDFSFGWWILDFIGTLFERSVDGFWILGEESVDSFLFGYFALVFKYLLF